MGWTDISASRKDADSPLDEDLISDLDDNTIYNHDRGIRSGTHVTGVRTCMARGKTAFNWSTVTSAAVQILFNTALDGDPNFLAAPTVVVTLEENAAGDNWGANGPKPFIEQATLDTDECYVTVGWDAVISPQGWVHWVAIGKVTAGE